jgi:octaprenyl-diphosphate synthase
MMVALDSMAVMRILSRATNRIAEGEVLQLLNCNNPDTSEEEYLEVIVRKTAVLFEAGCRLGAIIAQTDPAIEQALSTYGLHLGTAFQLVDDALDYSATSEQLGKNLGDDLAEGKPTLPLIRAMAKGTAEESQLIRDAIQNGGRDQIGPILDIIASTGAIEYTARLAQQEAELAKQALNPLPASEYRDALAFLADYAVSRTY